MNSQLDTMLAAQNAELIKALAEKTLALDDKIRDIAIEAALEKVRSRSLAMRKSDELQEVINTIYEQLLQLGVTMDSVNFIIFYEGRRDFDLWLAEPQHIYTSRMYIPEIDCFPTIQWFDAVQKGVDFFTITCSFEQKNTWYNYAFEHSGLKQTTPERRRRLLEAKYWTIAWAINNYSAVQLNSFSRDSFSANEHYILQRFAKVFEQAYIRFLDVQKAEEQARESQIQLALERVRARTMAMQKSGELAEAIQQIFEQFVHLGFKINVATFNMDYRADNNFRLWIASAYQRYPSMVFTPYLDHPVFNIPLAAIDAGSDHFVTKLTLSEKNQYLDHFFKNSSPIPDLPADMLDHIYNAPGYDSYAVLMKTVALTVTNYLGYAYTEAEEAVVMRFGKVFEQTYTRFLDLKKAEEQAREANIEAHWSVCVAVLWRCKRARSWPR
jgi:oligoribonuclease (3'-5' exoribonuclease)